MTALFLAAVIAAPLIWFVWRWTRLRADRERPPDLPAPDAPIADRINTATPETVRSADVTASVDVEEPPVKAGEEKPPEEQPVGEQPSALRVVALVVVENELGTATHQFAKSHPCKEDNSAQPVASGQT